MLRIGLGTSPLNDADTEQAVNHALELGYRVVPRWESQQDVVPIPKSADPGRLAENLAIFDFDLTADQLAALSALDGTAKAAADSDRFGH